MKMSKFICLGLLLAQSLAHAQIEGGSIYPIEVLLNYNFPHMSGYVSRFDDGLFRNPFAVAPKGDYEKLLARFQKARHPRESDLPLMVGGYSVNCIQRRGLENYGNESSFLIFGKFTKNFADDAQGNPVVQRDYVGIPFYPQLGISQKLEHSRKAVNIPALVDVLEKSLSTWASSADFKSVGITPYKNFPGFREYVSFSTVFQRFEEGSFVYSQDLQSRDKVSTLMIPSERGRIWKVRREGSGDPILIREDLMVLGKNEMTIDIVCATEKKLFAADQMPERFR